MTRGRGAARPAPGERAVSSGSAEGSCASRYEARNPSNETRSVGADFGTLEAEVSRVPPAALARHAPERHTSAARAATLLASGPVRSYAQVPCWLYLGESSLVSTFTVVSARSFASFLPPPMPGHLRYFLQAPDCYFAWGAALLLAVTAVRAAPHV